MKALRSKIECEILSHDGEADEADLGKLGFLISGGGSLDGLRCDHEEGLTGWSGEARGEGVERGQCSGGAEDGERDGLDEGWV